MRSLIATQQATSKEVDVWMTSLAFIKHPSKDMMRELKVCNLNICLFGRYVIFKAELSYINTQHGTSK